MLINFFTEATCSLTVSVSLLPPVCSTQQCKHGSQLDPDPDLALCSTPGFSFLATGQ